MSEPIRKTSFEIETEKCISFLSDFIQGGSPKYLHILQEIALLKRTSLPIEISDLIEVSSSASSGSSGLFNPATSSLASSDVSSIPTDTDTSLHVREVEEEVDSKYPHYLDVIKNTKRYLTLFHEAAKTLIPTLIPETSNSLQDISLQNGQLRPYFLNEEKTKDFFKRFEIKFIVPQGVAPFSIRELDSSFIGRLVRIKGIVAKASTPNPLAKEIVYLCTSCGNEAIQKVNSDSFTPLSNCPSNICKNRSISGLTVSQKAARLIIQPKASYFIECQKLKIQEDSSSVIPGGIPKTISVLLIGNYKNRPSPGDHVIIDGVWLPAMKTGFLAMKTGLTSTSYLEGISISTSNASLTTSTNKDLSKIKARSLQNLINDFCPDIYGLEDVKTALLLMLTGGVTKKLKDQTMIRGNLNVLLVGDPGLAKSQLLQYTAKICERGITTTGRGSSGVGLTASVNRDKSGAILEGGALVMADEGICCIDEFDKMDENDRTGIHEVMEQQTVSIAKAGITATLNARTSILAASNPVFGKYNFKRDLESNVGIEPALLSRFDLIFVLIDKIEENRDEKLADHMLNKHLSLNKPKFRSPKKKPKTNKNITSNNNEEELKIEKLTNYIKKAKTFEPSFPKAVHDFIIKAYCDIRTQADILKKQNFAATPRMLMSVLRIAQAFAKLRFSNEVNRKDAEEAIRLIHESKDIDSNNLEKDGQVSGENEIEEIKELVVEMIKNNKMDSIEIDYIVERLEEVGYSLESVKECLERFEKENLWMKDGKGKKLVLV